jgi:hypothetical protein
MSRHRLFSALLIASAAVFQIGCTDYSTSVFIRQNQAPLTDSDCSVNNDPAAAALGSGSFYPNVQPNENDGAYNAQLLVGNQLIPRGDTAQLKPESNRIQLYEAEVSLLDAGGGAVGSSFFQTITGFADPSSGTAPGYGVAFVTLIPPGAVTADGSVVARVIVRGVTLGGEDVETAFWDYPIRVQTSATACTEPDTCEDDHIVACDTGQDVAPDCRDVIANHPCNLAGP